MKSEILLAVTLLLAGCDAMRVPVPQDAQVQLRAVFTGFVGEGIYSRLVIARPIDDELELSLLLPWIERSSTRFELLALNASGRRVSCGFAQNDPVGFKVALWPWGCSLGVEQFRIRGALRWNASSPYSLAESAWVRDSFEIAAQPSVRGRFMRTGIRGSLALRWPRLARSNSDLLLKWLAVPESVVAFRNDWRAVCKRRGFDDDRVLWLDTTTAPQTFRWKSLDTSDVRALMAGTAEAQDIFAAGDTIWTPLAHDANAVVMLEAPIEGPCLMQVGQGASETVGFLPPSEPVNSEVDPWGYRDYVWFRIPARFSASSNQPLRTIFQVTGVCPAFADWVRQGSTSRFQKPTGNVAPFDGYFCEVHPDTISFPEGDAILLPTSIGKGSSDSVAVAKPVTLINGDSARIVRKYFP